MKLYSNDGDPISWLTVFIALIVGMVLWMVIGCLPVGLVFLIAGAEAASMTAAIWAGFVGAMFIFSSVKVVRNGRANARIHGK
jgi:uncharacterized membrane protein YdcZ (DUF606 family)